MLCFAIHKGAPAEAADAARHRNSRRPPAFVASRRSSEVAGSSRGCLSAARRSERGAATSLRSSQHRPQGRHAAIDAGQLQRQVERMRQCAAGAAATYDRTSVRRQDEWRRRMCHAFHLRETCGVERSISTRCACRSNRRAPDTTSLGRRRSNRADFLGASAHEHLGRVRSALHRGKAIGRGRCFLEDFATPRARAGARSS